MTQGTQKQSSKREQPMTLCAVTQYLDPQYWLWDEDTLDQVLLSDEPVTAQAIMVTVWRRMLRLNIQPLHMHGIIHDKDQREVRDPQTGEMRWELKPEHIHMVIKFDGREGGGTLAQVAQAVGVKPEFVEKPGRGRYAYDNMLSYLCHAKYTDKYQYPPEAVVSLSKEGVTPELYTEVYNERINTWIKGRGSVKKKAAADNVDHLVELALTGQIDYERIQLTDELYEIYARNRRVIDEALETYSNRQMILAAKKLEAGLFRTSILYVTGAPGAGKTQLARYLIDQTRADAAHNGENWSVYKAATSNVLDGYRGQEIIFLDDLRANAMTATEWLLLLDPNNASPASARYQNKPFVAPRVVIMTAPIEPLEFFYYSKNRGGANEALDQFLRRLGLIVRVFRMDNGGVPAFRYRLTRTGAVDRYSVPVADSHQFLHYDEIEEMTVEVSGHESWKGAEILAPAIIDHIRSCSPDLGWEPSGSWDEHRLAALNGVTVPKLRELGPAAQRPELPRVGSLRQQTQLSIDLSESWDPNRCASVGEVWSVDQDDPVLDSVD